MSIGADKEGFSKGFYTDFEFTNEAKVKFIFSKEAETRLRGEKPKIFVRMIFSFECNESNLHYYRRHIRLTIFMKKSRSIIYMDIFISLIGSSMKTERKKKAYICANISRFSVIMYTKSLRREQCL